MKLSVNGVKAIKSSIGSYTLLRKALFSRIHTNTISFCNLKENWIILSRNTKSYWICDNSSSFYSVNLTTSFGSHSKIRQSFSNVIKVMFLFFFKESKVLLSIPFFNNWYCVTPFSSIVIQSGEKSIIVITSFTYDNSIIEFPF